MLHIVKNFKMLFKKIFLFLVLIKICGTFDIKFKVGYCTYQCSNENINSVGPDIIKGYFWRDFNGDIPPDAFPVGNEKQSPQTYIGHVVDQETNGLHVVAIFAGQPYVYLALNDTVKKLFNHIQILCSQEPETLNFVSINELSKKPEDGKYIQGGNDNSSNPIQNIVRISKDQCGMNYVGKLSTLEDTVRYTTSKGTPQIAEPKEMSVLYYLPKISTKKENKGDNSLIQHRIHVMINEDSIIPKFYRKRKHGFCSSTCTNMDLGGQNSLTEGYYWKPNYIDQSDRLPAGASARYKSLYVVQSFEGAFNMNPISKGNPESPNSVYGWYAVLQHKQISASVYTAEVLCAKSVDNFKWVKTNSSSVFELKDKMLIPGLLPNGTPIAVGRAMQNNDTYPGGVYMTDKPMISIINDNYMEHNLNDFEVLLYEGTSRDKTGTRSNSQLRNIFNNLQKAIGVSFKLKF